MKYTGMDRENEKNENKMRKVLEEEVKHVTTHTRKVLDECSFWIWLSMVSKKMSA